MNDKANSDLFLLSMYKIPLERNGSHSASRLAGSQWKHLCIFKICKTSVYDPSSCAWSSVVFRISIIVVFFICAYDEKTYKLRNVINFTLFYFLIFKVISLSGWTLKFCWVYNSVEDGDIEFRTSVHILNSCTDSYPYMYFKLPPSP